MIETLDHCKILYNSALLARKIAWEKEKKFVRLYDQYNELTEIREDLEFSKFSIVAQRSAIERLDLGFKHWFGESLAFAKVS